ncbi:MAG: iron-sulfur cluster assembly scaffold protein [Croceibacterium sp.]
MSGAQRLYTPELLALAVELARVPPLTRAALHSEARSPTCGSTLAVDLVADASGTITQLGLRVRACAIGQAAAAIFARHAVGNTSASIAQVLSGLEAWLGGEGELPNWPDLAMIAPAREYPARHGAILLPWKAAAAALSSTAPAS